MAALAEVAWPEVRVESDAKTRCFGLCAEEQTVLQLARRGVGVELLRTSTLPLVRVSCRRAVPPPRLTDSLTHSLTVVSPRPRYSSMPLMRGCTLPAPSRLAPSLTLTLAQHRPGSSVDAVSAPFPPRRLQRDMQPLVPPQEVVPRWNHPCTACASTSDSADYLQQSPARWKFSPG